MYKHVAKKIASVLLVILVIISVGYFAFFLFIGSTLNDVKTASYCGNTSGAGNHIEIWADVLIRSKLEIDKSTESWTKSCRTANMVIDKKIIYKSTAL